MIVHSSRDNRELWRTIERMPVYSFVPVLPSSDNGPARMVPRRRICGRVSSRRYHQRGPVSVRKKGKRASVSLPPGHVPFTGAFHQRTVALRGKHPGFPLLTILWLELCRAMLLGSTSLEGNQKHQNDNGVQRTLWRGSDARENDTTLYMNF